MSKNPGERLVVGVGQMDNGLGDGILIGIPAKAWEEMQNGMGKDIDLRKIGIPIVLMVFGGKDRAECEDTILKSNESVRENPMYDLSVQWPKPKKKK